MYKAYIYPVSNRLKSGIYNPYIDNFINSNSRNYLFVNQKHPSNAGIFNIIRFIGKVDVVFFNWIEKLPDFKGGFLQMAFLFLLLRYCKFKRIKIVWTVHNKIAHSNGHLLLKKAIFKEMIKQSDLIITHSTEGKAVIDEYSSSPKRVFYFPHPVTMNLLPDNSIKKYDILIWGSLVSYKGIDLFLKFLHDNNLQNNYSIHIIGKCNDKEYLKKIESFSNNRIKIENRFPDSKELDRLIEVSRIVLFTYCGESVLTSGALAESVSRGAMVIGPEKAAFKDMADLKYIFSYKNFESLVEIINKILSGEKTISKERFDQYIKEYNWDVFAGKLQQELYQLN